MLNLVSFQTCNAYYFYLNESDEIMVVYFQLIVYLKSFEISSCDRRGKNSE